MCSPMNGCLYEAMFVRKSECGGVRVNMNMEGCLSLFGSGGMHGCARVWVCVWEREREDTDTTVDRSLFFICSSDPGPISVLIFSTTTNIWWKQTGRQKIIRAAKTWSRDLLRMGHGTKKVSALAAWGITFHTMSKSLQYHISVRATTPVWLTNGPIGANISSW